MKTYKVSKECIGCRACIEVAEDNFKMNSAKKAFVIKQPENNEQEKNCDEALSICPVEAIIFEDFNKDIDSNNPKNLVVLATSNIKTTLDAHPSLKDVLVNLSPRFEKMQNPVLYNTLARFANFNDAARVTGLSVCEILHTINKHLGVEDKLLKNMPECAKQVGKKYNSSSVDISWEESLERYIYNTDTLDELVPRVSDLKPEENIVILSVERPDELLKIAEGLDFKYNLEHRREYRISIFNPAKKRPSVPWLERKDTFEVLDVRRMRTDPFDIILKKAYGTPEDHGFVLVQKFEPAPMISMLNEMGFEHVTEERGFFEYWVYFHKVKTEKETSVVSKNKVDVVIQSATPVAYPVIMRLLQSDKIRESMNITELKVWEETEKHLAWITSGKADISFSALITAAKLRNSDIKIPALFVWDNFVLLSRDKVESFKDIKGKEIYTPLFEEAPPAKITKYLIKASGFDPDDFKFVFGKPFGRPEEIFNDFVTGKADTVILREPEASYAIKTMEDRKQSISVLSFNEIWNDINPGFGSFPNAGLVIKGEFAKAHPDETKILLDELKLAIEWVNNNQKDSANLSFDMMRQSVDKVELFLKRVNFDYVEGEPLKVKVKNYFDILNSNDIVDVKLDDEFYSLFDPDFDDNVY